MRVHTHVIRVYVGLNSLVIYFNVRCAYTKVQECCRRCQNENIFGRELHKENALHVSKSWPVYSLKRLNRLYGYLGSRLNKQNNILLITLN